MLNDLTSHSRILERFVDAVEEGYLPNPYHSATHAADVVHGCFKILSHYDMHHQVSRTLHRTNTATVH